ncbi:hypothetical protein PLANTIT3_80009 [Plantibacter sp. T3]|nr:hypothetical protein PLANTIT3_80009 [Plantibacter sp. T3]
MDVSAGLVELDLRHVEHPAAESLPVGGRGGVQGSQREPLQLGEVRVLQGTLRQDVRGGECRTNRISGDDERRRDRLPALAPDDDGECPVDLQRARTHLLELDLERRALHRRRDDVLEVVHGADAAGVQAVGEPQADRDTGPFRPERRERTEVHGRRGGRARRRGAGDARALADTAGERQGRRDHDDDEGLAGREAAHPVTLPKDSPLGQRTPEIGASAGPFPRDRPVLARISCCREATCAPARRRRGAPARCG